MSQSKASALDKQLLATLDKLGGQKVGDDSLVFEGNKTIIPAVYANDLGGFIKFLKSHIEAQSTTHTFSRKFRKRPWDGAVALRRAFKKYLGIDVVGKTVMSFFGPIPPQLIDVPVSPTEVEQAPWGEVDVQLFGGTMHMGSYRDAEYGLCFQLVVEAPKKHASRVEALFKMVEQELEENSIYRGKVIDGSENPGFRDPYGTDASRVIYTDQAMADIDANIWTAIEHMDALKDLGVPIKRAVLLEGPWGTGKTLLADVTAQKCIENGVTFIYCRPGQDDMEQVMRTARLYQPAVVFIEDVDVAASEGSRDEASALLDLFDGLDAKNNDVIVVLTTNHVEAIHKGMLRPGRLDSIIHIGAMDDKAREKLIRALVPAEFLGKDLDFVAINEAMQGYMPAFVKEAVDRTMRYAVGRLDGKRPEFFVTSDFVEAANSLREQFNLHETANEGVVAPALDTVMQEAVKRALTQGIGVWDGQYEVPVRLVDLDDVGNVYEVRESGDGIQPAG